MRPRRDPGGRKGEDVIAGVALAIVLALVAFFVGAVCWETAYFGG